MKIPAASRITCVIGLALAACGGGGGDKDECTAPPAACPTPVPSYSATVASVIQSHCAVCHTAGGAASNYPLTNYDQIQSLGLEMQGQLAACAMPPAGATQLTSADRAALLAWLVCGTPQN